MSFLYRNRIGFLLLVLKFALPYLAQNPVYEMHRDEFLYLEQGNHLAWGFMEIPPLLSIFSKATLLLGGDIFWVKFWPALFGGLTVFITCSICREMGGRSFAQLIAGLCLILGVYLRSQFLFQPNFLEIFFWTLSAYYVVRYINSLHTRYLYYLAVALGLALLSKYSAVFFIAGLGAGIVLTHHRKLFLNRHLYGAVLLTLILILHNVLWQYYHNWPVIHHMKELQETQLQFIDPLDFFKGQLFMHLPYFFVWIGGLWWLFFSPQAKPYKLLGWTYLAVVVLLAAGNGKDYYAMGAYPMLFAAGGRWLQHFTTGRTWLKVTSLSIMLLLFLPVLPYIMPIWIPAKSAAYYKKIGLDKAGALNWEDLKTHELPQDFADMISWKEMGDKVSRAYAALPDSMQSQTMIYCRNYALAGAVTYHGTNLPQVMSDNASFLFWMPDHYNIKHMLFVGRNIPKQDDIVFQQFERVTIIDSITTPLARERGVKIILYQNGNAMVNRMIEESIREQKALYRR